jgi:hypothetical protein
MRSRTILIAALVACALAAPGTAALACGMTVSADGSADLQGISALVSFDGAHEDLAVVVSYASPTGAFAWLMPLPATPQISSTSIEGLSNAFRITTPPLESAYTLEPNAPYGVPERPGGVSELGRATIGNLEFVTLGATDAGEVATWMKAHGFAYHDTQLASIQGYLARHWVLVAAHTTAAVTPPYGAIAVRLTFPTPEPVFPLAIAGASHQGTLPMHLLVATSYRPVSATYSETTVLPASNGTEPAPQSRLELRYASILSETERLQLAKTIAVPYGYWLTRYDATWQVSDLNRDLVFNRADDQSRVNFDGLYRRFQAERNTADSNNRRLQLAIVGSLLTMIVGSVAFAGIVITVLARPYRRRS